MASASAAEVEVEVEVEVESMMDKVALECGGDISSSQEDILARSAFLGGSGSQEGDGEGEEEQEVFTTPPFTQITMCTLPFSPSPAPSDDDDQHIKVRRKPRVCTRKVRGARIRTPTPSPDHDVHLDPLYTAVLMIPTTNNTQNQNPVDDFLVLASQRGLF